jgi:hypothetical protein
VIALCRIDPAPFVLIRSRSRRAGARLSPEHAPPTPASSGSRRPSTKPRFAAGHSPTGDLAAFIHIDLGEGALHRPFLATDKPLLSIASRTSSLNPPGYKPCHSYLKMRQSNQCRNATFILFVITDFARFYICRYTDLSHRPGGAGRGCVARAVADGSS